MNITELKRIALLITGRHASCLHEFTAKEVATFLVQAGVARERIAYFQAQGDNLSLWLLPLLRELSTEVGFAEILQSVLSEVTFYNPEAIDEVRLTYDKATSGDKVGVFMDFDSDRLHLYANVIKPAVAAAGLEAQRVDEKTLAGGDLHHKIQSMIHDHEYFVIDISGPRPNKFIELGELIALNKKVILLHEEGNERPFNISHLKMIDYPRASQDTEITKQNHAKLSKEITDELIRLKNAM